jgi:hypothetical protein
MGSTLSKIRLAAVAVSLLVAWGLQAGPVERFREMSFAKPFYIKRTGEAWKKGGRIIGTVKHPNKDFTVEFYHAGRLVKTFKAPGKMNIYMTGIMPPGVYKLVFKSSGYHKAEVKRLRVKSGYDCVLDVIMGLRVYENR